MAVKSKRKQEQAKERAAKRAAMHVPGGESKYAKRRAARLRGEPMSSRAHESAPWWDRAGLAVRREGVALRSEEEIRASPVNRRLILQAV